MILRNLHELLLIFLVIVELSLAEFFGQKDHIFVLFKDCSLTWLHIEVIDALLRNLQVLEVRVQVIIVVGGQAVTVFAEVDFPLVEFLGLIAGKVAIENQIPKLNKINGHYVNMDCEGELKNNFLPRCLFNLLGCRHWIRCYFYSSYHSKNFILFIK